MSTQGYASKPRRRVWVQHVAVEADRLETEVAAARQRGLDPREEAIAEGVTRMIAGARRAAFREDPVPRRWTNWWRGTLVEAAYLHLHAARSQLVDLYDPNELLAEIPTSVARAQQSLHRDDPRRTAAVQLLQADTIDPERARPVLRRLVGDSYEKSDLEHAQLRSFRNVVLISALLMLVLVVATVAVIAVNPNWMPFCFTADGGNLVCATSTGRTGARSADIIMVALLGALGGTLTSAVSIRNLKGTSTPYDVPVALGMLKVPLGAFTAILALVAIRGGFVPGLTNLDSQEQILAYALVFGFAQQALSRLLDRRAQTLLEGLPGGTTNEPAPSSVPAQPGTTTVTDPGVPLGPDETADATDEATVDLPPGGELLPDDVDVIGDVDDSDEAVADADGGDEGEGDDAAGPGTDEADLELLPDADETAYVEDKNLEPAGPDADDGVIYPTAEDEQGAKS